MWRCAAPCERELPRSGTLAALPRCQRERMALDMPDAASTHALGRSGMGAAVADRARLLETVRPRPRPSATIVTGSGPAGCATGTALGPDKRASGGRP